MGELDALCRALMTDTPGSLAAGLLDVASGRLLARARRNQSETDLTELIRLTLELHQAPETGALSADLRRWLGAPAPAQPAPRKLQIRSGSHHLLLRASRDGRTLLFLATENGEPGEETWAQVEVTADLVSALSGARLGLASPATAQADRGTTHDPSL